jgi:hypothetical protein
MKRFARIGLLVIATSMAGGPAGAQPVGDLVQKLQQSSDFRVRVQAALELGKTKGRPARLALQAALDDENAAVRAAAAAGLKVLGDPAALDDLHKHENDSSPAVRAQIQSTVTALQSASTAGKASQKPDVLVQFGKIHVGASASGIALDDVERTSKQKLGQLPGIAVVDAGKDAPAPRGGVPVIMLTGRVKQLEQSREGSSVVYLASVEFVLHKMPGQTIKGVVSGSARASGSPDERQELQKSALEAAIDSAVRRAPQALRAAAQ